MDNVQGYTEFTLSQEMIDKIEKECNCKCQGVKGSFEVCIHRPGLWGKIWGNICERDCPPANIIRADREWGINLCWCWFGNLVPFICGEWCVKFHFESMGAGEEFDLPRPKECLIKIPVDPCKNCYETTYWVSAGTIRPEHCGTPYKVIATVQYLSHCKGKPGPITGFVEFPLIEFYDATI